MEISIEFKDTSKLSKADLVKYSEQLETELLKIVEESEKESKLIAEKEIELDDNVVAVNREDIDKLHQILTNIQHHRILVSPAGAEYLALLTNIISRIRMGM